MAGEGEEITWFPWGKGEGGDLRKLTANERGGES